MTGEANSLTDIELPREQLEYIKKLHRFGKPIIGVMCFGRPIGLEEAEPYLEAILYAWHAGTRGANSIAKALFGAINPSGKLPMTMPRTTGQIPIYYNNPTTTRNVFSYYQLQNAYRDRLSTPLYPFGYGLSYTDFEYSSVTVENPNLSLDELKQGEKFRIKTKIKNIGSVDGKETAQCYIRAMVSTMIRPNRELKGFIKEFYSAGEEKEICFELGFDELAYYDGDSNFTVEPGAFEVHVGTDCYADLMCKITVTK